MVMVGNERNCHKVTPVMEHEDEPEIAIEVKPEVCATNASQNNRELSSPSLSPSSLSSPKNEKLEQIQIDFSSNPEVAVTIHKLYSSVLCTSHSQLPKPEPPPGAISEIDSNSTPDHPQFDRSKSLPETSAIGKYIRERSNSLSAAISERFADSEVTEFNLPELKVIVKQKEPELRGRITFFSRSDCRDCTAVRSFFREKELNAVEINVDVYPEREKELVQRTEGSQVPQIFFNEKLFGGLVALNSLRNSGGFEERVRELVARKCPDEAPSPPVYGAEEAEEEWMDEMVEAVRVVRKRVPIQDRLVKMRMVRKCFAGSEMVEVLVRHFDCGNNKAIEMGKQLVRRHFIHHVFGKNDFEDGNELYQLLEHDPSIPKCFNFIVSTNDSEPKSAAKVGRKLIKLMSAILESFASDDRTHVDYEAISKSEEFRRYVNLVQELHRVNLYELSLDEKLAFFLNLYNAMVIHAVIRLGHPEGIIDRGAFSSNFQYMVGGYPYSLDAIKNGILRSNRRPPYSLVKTFGSEDKRLEHSLPKLNPLIHFGLCNGTRSSPKVRFFSSQVVEAQLRCAARDFFKSGGLEVDLGSSTIYLTRIINWSSADFGQDKEMLKWIVDYLDPNRAGLLTHLLGDGGSIRIVYQNYDWSVNS